MATLGITKHAKNVVQATLGSQEQQETLLQNGKKSDTVVDSASAAPSAASFTANSADEGSANTEVTYHLKDLKRKSPEGLMIFAESLHVENPESLQKHDLIFAILQHLAEKGGVMVGEGILEILQDGYGFLRSPESNYVPGPDDIYVSPNQIRKYALRTGDTIAGPIRAPRKNERYFAITNISTINGSEPLKNKHRPHFDDLTPLYPEQLIMLESIDGAPNTLSARIIDIVSPLGRGQRALIVAPPRTGKTMLIQNIAHSITRNYPDIILIVLLIDERPEEVTDMLRSVKGEVVSSTFDEPYYRHVQLAEMVIEKAKRLVETKKDVVILLDSITRLARAYNNIAPSSGKVLSGGVDSNALQRPKRFFGAARNIEEKGSLTIIATALIETGSRMDEVIFEEFKGTGNSEIILDRKIADRRIFPAIDISKSGTRKEDLLVDKTTLSKIWILRKIINPMGPTESIEFLIDKLKPSKFNHEFFQQMDTYSSNNKTRRE
ncbi:transcription termination factor Rho [Alphaproteobacteria bacterium]